MTVLESPVEVCIEIPQRLIDAIGRALERHPEWGQDDVINAAIAVFLAMDEAAHEPA
jgi:hypothetical protein